MNDKNYDKEHGWRDNHKYYPEQAWWYKWLWALIVFITGALLIMADYKG